MSQESPPTESPAPQDSPLKPQDSSALGSSPPADRKWITAALLLVMVLASMEATVTSTAMPTIIGDLHGLEHYS